MSDELTAPNVSTTSNAANAPALPSGDKWSEDISDARKQELVEMLCAWKAETDHGERRGSFDGQQLTAAEVYWLAEQVRNETRCVPDLYLETLYVNTPRVATYHDRTVTA
jgi:hypothetical protein